MNTSLKRVLTLMLAGVLVLTGFAAMAEADGVFTQEMIQRSLVSTGNTERLNRAIEKARNGEEVSIVYLGGSITEGASARPQATRCYAYLSAHIFADKYMPDASKLKYHNAGISGTPSLLGVTRCQQDVLRHEPDIVFVEFAVNDGTDGTSRLAYESLVSKLLNSPSQPAVILVFTLTDSGYSAQTHMQAIGSHYGLGMISIRDAVQPQITLGKMKWSDYSADFAHPNTAGHAFVADCIGYYFDEAAKVTPEPYVMPEKACYGTPLAGLVNLQKNDPIIISEGSFPYGNASCYSYRQGWRHLAAKGGNEPLTFQITGTHMTLVFKQENNASCGRVQVRVDGKLKIVLNGYSTSAWGNPVTEMVFLGDNKTHTVEIRMADGDENKNFTLLDVGYAGR